MSSELIRLLPSIDRLILPRFMQGSMLLKTAIKICEEEQDDDTEMDHAYWLKQQLGLIDKIGLQNYLQSQM